MKTTDAVKAPATGDVTAISPRSNYFRWDEPESDITVLLKPETLERLQSEILREIDSSPRAANESGGFLLGATEREQGRVLITVEDLAPVRRQHPNGPFYTLSREDSLAFEAAVKSSKADPALTAVGYYRSHSRDGLFLSAEDLKLIQRHFPESENLFLLIKPLSNRTCTAGFFFWKDGRIQSEFTDSEVPLIPISRPAAQRPSAAPAPAAPASEENRSLTLAAPNGATTVREWFSKKIPIHALLGWRPRLIGGIAIASVALAVTVVVVRNRAPRPIHRSNKTEISIAVPQPEPAAPAADVPAPLRKSSVPPGVGSRPAQTRIAVPASGTPQVTRAAVAPFRPPPEAPAAPPPSAVAIDEPSLNTVASSPPALTIAQTIPAIQPPVSVPAASAVPAAPPNSAAHPAAHTHIGPRVLRQATPVVPRTAASRIAADVLIAVEAAIDSTGKVTGARVASTSGTGAELLTIEALKAAHLFRFQPAQEDGRNVASTTVLTFHFGTKNPINRE